MIFRGVLYITCCLTLSLALISLGSYSHGQANAESDWPYYGNDPGGMRHSSLAQINRENVQKLKVAWIYHTGDISDGRDGRRRSGFETTPILVDGLLYLTTPFNRVIALDPATGKQVWAYDANIDQNLDYGDGLINRGVATLARPFASCGKDMPTAHL
jgi:quinoprotein glucose dehydrogenase